MKFLHIILALSLILIVPLLVVESSSSSHNNLVSNITRGSSISSNDPSPYWLSPSGNLAFGFYHLPQTPDRYVVSIWFVKSSQKTRVWTAKGNDFPLHKPSLIMFTEEGKIVLRIIPDNKDILLLQDVPEPASYAKMHDDGNFVLYGSESQIVWESFDHPTDTILASQKLKAGTDLISGKHRLSVSQTDDGYVAIYRKRDVYIPEDGIQGAVFAESVSVMSDALERSVGRPVTLNLDTTGKLYLASSYDEVIKVFYQDKRKQQVQEEGDYIYRAILNSKGRFDLHKERIDGNDSQKSSSSIVWSSSYKTHITPNSAQVTLASTVGISAAVLLAGATLFY